MIPVGYYRVFGEIVLRFFRFTDWFLFFERFEIQNTYQAQFISRGRQVSIDIQMPDEIDQTILNARKVTKIINESINQNLDTLTQLLPYRELIDDFIQEKPYIVFGIGAIVGFGLSIVVCGLTIPKTKALDEQEKIGIAKI